MNEHSHSQTSALPVPPIWKFCTGMVLLCAGPLIILSVVLYWTSGFFRPQIAQLGLITIWAGVLFLQTKKTYFSVVSSLILLLSLVGFADNLIFDVGQPSNSDPKFVIHGLFSLAWMIVFAVQAELVRTRHLRFHMSVGNAGFLAALGFTVSTFYLFYVLWEPWSEMSNRVQCNRILLPSFLVLIVLAWAYRHRPEFHKRMILMGTLYVQLPIIARAVAGLVPATIILWGGLFPSLFVYDWIAVKRVHPVTYLGTAWFCLVWGIVIVT